MENRFVPARFKDGYGPVGAWFLLFKAKAMNGTGEDYQEKNAALLQQHGYGKYVKGHAMGTCLRNHLMMHELKEGRGPIFIDTATAMRNLAASMTPEEIRHLEAEAWEDFLDMTVGQCGVWTGENIEPDKEMSELMPTEPYLLDSHAGCAGIWCSGPADIPGTPEHDPILPVELRADSTFQFRCHPGVACFNSCCRNIEVTLTPYDILRLKRRFGMKSNEFVGEHTIPFEMDSDRLPGLKLRTKPGTTECAFLGERGCTVYDDRPIACRYYALGNMGVRRKDEPQVEDIYFVVRESHCLGHEEPHRQTVAEYRTERGIEHYDEMNREWRNIVLKKRSSGPTVGAPSARSLQLFDMCSYDLDSFRAFVLSDGFRDLFDADDAALGELARDEDKLLAFSMRFLNQVLFGVESIPIRPGARERRISKRKAVWAARRRDAVARHREDLERQQYGK